MAERAPYSSKAEKNSPVYTKYTVLIGKVFIFFVWFFFLLFIGVIGLELVFRMTSKVDQEQRPVYEKIRAAYRPFSIQYLDPLYLFFFSIDKTKRIAVNNEICSVTEEGFRGKGPEEAGTRKLAFLLGGSSAFGSHASSDSRTISGYLNQMQDEYFFVNAGVPSWNSNQELYRLLNQILRYEPSLVFAYDGANDIRIMLNFWRGGYSFSPGTPENFDELSVMVDHTRGSLKSKAQYTQKIVRRFFPNVAAVTARLLKSITSKNTHPLQGKKEKPFDPDLEKLIDQTADKYVYNLSLMWRVAMAQQCRFIGIFQPMRSLHRSAPDKFRAKRERVFYENFRQFVLEKYTPHFEYYDFSNIFDHSGKEVEWFDRSKKQDITEKTTFVDEVHLYDYGNKIVAQKILSLL